MQHEGINQAGLAELLELEPISLARCLDRMEQAGWVERRADPADRRARLLYMTDEGASRCSTSMLELGVRDPAWRRCPAWRRRSATRLVDLLHAGARQSVRHGRARPSARLHAAEAK